VPAEELVSELAEELALESEESSEPAAALPGFAAALPEFAIVPLVPPLGVCVCLRAVPEPACDPAGFAVSGSQGLSGSGA
jgi:hypothetical protein